MRRVHVQFGLAAGIAGAVLGAPSAAQAQDAAPRPATNAPQQQPDTDESEPDKDEEEAVVVVVAQQHDQTRIDRRVYAIADDPIAQSSAMLDVLGRIPSVTIAPSGAIRLLGAENVTIQVDGQPVPGESLDVVLRSLTGSEVERIEVITNPSAQYSASAEGGIINIVTRRRFRLGLTGAITGGGDSLGGYNLNAAPTWTRGAWSYGLRAGGSDNRWGGASTRDREILASGAHERDIGNWIGESKGYYAGGEFGYRPSDARRANLSLFMFDFDSLSHINTTREDDNGPVFNQDLPYLGNVRGTNLTFDLQQNGAAAGEVFKFNAFASRVTQDTASTITVTPSDGSPETRYETPKLSRTQNANLKFDYERPFGEQRLLALGISVEDTDQDLENGLRTLSGPPTAPDFASVLHGGQTVTAAYGTYQFPLGEWTILPGLRTEFYARELRSGASTAEQSDIDYFPSLHTRRKLREGLDLDLSYSRRIARPRFEDLDPALRYSEPTRANSGNPGLDPTFTDALEANLTYEGGQKTISVTLFDRLSDNIISQLTETNSDGVILTMPVNAGESRQRGAQLIVRQPIGGGWRTSLSANLLSRSFDVLRQGVTSQREESEYSGNAQIEYMDRAQSEVGADHVQLEVQFQGPQHYLQGERDAYTVANFTWRRRLTGRLSSVFAVQDIFDSNKTVQDLRTDAFSEHFEREGAGTRVRLTLTYQFGEVRGPPQDANGPNFGGGN